MAQVMMKDLNKKYDEVHAVKDVNLHIRDKEFIVLVGPSGCGKSTTLRMVAGLEEITSGEISIGDRVVNDLPPKDRDIAMVFQNYALYPHMSVYDNMAFGLKMRKFPKAEIQKRVQDAAEILGIQELLKRKPRQLSGGQRQRVAVGRAIVRHPQVFLFDEPLSNLDAKLRVQMRVELKRLHERLETTAIYVTHDQVEAMTLGDRVVVMKDGWIQQVGEPLELYGRPANKFVAGFIGSPSMNFVDVKVADANGALWVETQGYRVKVPPTHASRLVPYKGQQVTMGVRPEDLHPASGSDPREYCFDAVVDVVEPLGSEILLDLRAGNSTIVARVEPTMRVKVHESTRLAPPSSRWRTPRRRPASRQAEHARRHDRAASRHPGRVPAPRPHPAPAPHGAGVPGRVGGVDEPDRSLAAQGRPDGVRRARELPPLPRRSRVLARGDSHCRVRRRHERRQAEPRRRLRPAAGPAVPRPRPRLPRGLPSLGVPGERERDRLVLDPQPAHSDRLQRVHGQREVRGGRRARRRGVGLPERHAVQHLARQLVHRRVPPGRDQRRPARAVRVRGARIEERLAPLLARDGAAPQAVPRPRRVPVADHGLRRPRQRLDADRRAHRLPGRRDARVLARDPRGTVRSGLRPLPDAGPLPPRGAPDPVQDVRSAGKGAGVNPKPWWRKLGHGSLLLVATVYCVFPIYFMLVQSLKTAEEDVFGNPLIVVNPTFENFEELFERTGEARGFVGSVLRRNYPVLEWLENTVVVFAGSVTVTLVASILAAYALGRLRPPGFRWWRRAIFATYVIPHTILFVPLYQVILHLHLDDNLLALLLVYPTLALPFCVWILSAYFQQFPREVEESALVEGASRVTAFVRIILPM